jgi:hypothetical protein
MSLRVAPVHSATANASIPRPTAISKIVGKSIYNPNTIGKLTIKKKPTSPRVAMTLASDERHNKTIRPLGEYPVQTRTAWRVQECSERARALPPLWAWART